MDEIYLLDAFARHIVDLGAELKHCNNNP